MTQIPKPYPNARAVEAAIKDAAKREHQAHPSRQVADLIRQTYYDRFLCRVFAEGESNEWVLKGGSGMLARLPNARRTLDADLYRDGFQSKDQALEELRRLAHSDLGDFFRFEYRAHHTILDDDTQPYADGYRVIFDTYLGVKELDPIKVDLSIHVGATDNIVTNDPANRLDLPKLATYPYRLYPLSSQIADKVCATIIEYPGGRPSSREKDLVDLVIIAVTQNVRADTASEAVQRECRKRQVTCPKRFTIPPTWGARYTRMAKGTPAGPYPVDTAKELMARFVDPLLDGTAAGIWDPSTRQWRR
ncbi:MAG: nucleotidyl transferase AbiEii/AbiGii toxin family protein [Bifidobacteriaceae bacterium]|jgi:hypothetical protein|nr:nucleotidyl transferase AbiEii/AbiGii toxin family protein [Bifidobacteriaceae bacterium]